MAIKPIFVFSITRSGSTLLQRVIAAHDGVATVSEPWLLLPQLYALRRDGATAEYGHPLMVTAVEDFCKELPGGSEDYLAELREFVLRLYRRAAGAEARYFLDKSPPYYFVVDDIMALFPEGKFVFLWRNPLGIVASIIETWLDGQWNPTLFHEEDLFVGLPRLVSTYSANPARAHAIRFEDLLAGDMTPWRQLMNYLELEFDANTLQTFAEVTLRGHTGDPVGVRRYASLDSEPTHKWKATIANPVRRRWCRQYINFLGSERLDVMGYDKVQLLSELDSQANGMESLLPDLGRLASYVMKAPVRSVLRDREVSKPNVLRTLIHA